VVILTRLSQSLPEAVALFEAKWGKELIRVSYGDAAAPPAELERAEVVLAYSMHAEEARSLAPRMKPLISRGVRVMAHWPEGAERQWGLRQDAGRLAAIVEYWNYGGAENMARMLGYLYGEVAGRQGVKVEAAESQLTAGIYHPKAKGPFATLAAYEQGYGARRRTGAARVGILFYHTNLKNGDMAHIDVLIAALEAKGLEPVAVFGWPPVVCEPLLMGPGGSAVEALFALNLGFAKPDDAALLARLNVHVMALMTTKQTRAEWLQSPHGIRTDQLALQVAAPERAGQRSRRRLRPRSGARTARRF